MTNNKTTALIEHVAKAIIIARDGKCDGERRFQDPIIKKAYIGDAKAALEALAAFEQPAVREMSVDECMKELEIAYDNEIDSFNGKQYCAPSASKAMALAIAKLGTIRVVEG